tara:strand:- start:609 stop:4844 length:4236 start_codon:yes stop_codon:yes gene_type:complete
MVLGIYLIVAVAVASAQSAADEHAAAGQAAYADGRVDDAISLVRQAIQLAPRRPGFHSGLGQLHSRRGDVRPAVESFVAALRLLPAAVVIEREGWLDATVSDSGGGDADVPGRGVPQRHVAAQVLNHLGLAQRGRALSPTVRVDSDESVRLLRLAARHFLLATEMNPDAGDDSALSNAILTLDDAGDVDAAAAAARRMVLTPDGAHRTPAGINAWLNAGVALLHAQQPAEAAEVYRRALVHLPLSNDAGDGPHPLLLLNAGAAAQSSGRLDDAVTHYRRLLMYEPQHMGALNNIAACLMYQGFEPEALAAFEEVLRVEPNSHHALTNYGVFLQNEGRTEEAVASFEKAIASLASGGGGAAAAMGAPSMAARQTIGALRVQTALILPPVMDSVASIARWRSALERQIDAMLAAPPSSPLRPRFDNPTRRLFQTSHFYLVYHGMNDARINTKIVALFRNAVDELTYVAPNLLLSLRPKPPTPPPPSPRLRSRSSSDACSGMDRISVGFVSKFFVKNHPHGQLLQGIIGGLTPGVFHPIIFAIANPREPLADWMQMLLNAEAVGNADDASATVVVVEPTIPALRDAVSAIQGGLDVLVFADLLSEPVTYFSAFGRLARTQCVFWGNPVTSGQPTVDYFISGERLEPIFAPNPDGGAGFGSTVGPHYTEQVLLLGDQGIWYAPIDPPRRDVAPLSRADYGLPSDDGIVIIACLGSVFKLHPEFDTTLHRILAAVPNAHLALLTGRRDSWTKRVYERLRRVMESPPDDSPGFTNITKRVHFLPRQAGQTAFVEMIAVAADVVAHPFPFGGSKTAADALAAGRPFVALQGKSLRGHMAVALLDTLALTTCPTCAARSVDEYVRTVVALAQRPRLRAAVAVEIEEKRELLWSRSEVIREWERFFLRAASAAGSTTMPDRFPPISKLRLIASGAEHAGELGCAEDALRRLLLLLPRDQSGPVYSDLGAVLQQADRLLEAEGATRTAIELLPPSPVLYNNLGVILRALGRGTEALSAYRFGLALVRAQKSTSSSHHHLGSSSSIDDELHDKLLMNAGNLLKDAGHFAAAVSEIAGGLPLELGISFDDPHTAMESTLPNFGEAAVLLALHDPAVADDGVIRTVGASLPGKTATGVQTLDIVVHRLRNHFLDSTNALAVISSTQRELKMDALRTALLLSTTIAAGPIAKEVHAAHEHESVDLIVQHFTASSEERQREIDDVLCKNLQNPHVDRVHVLAEEGGSSPFNVNQCGAGVVLKEKRIHAVVKGRLTFKGALEYAAQRIAPGAICVIVNADIVMTAASALQLRRSVSLANGDVFALLRWEIEPTGETQWVPRIDQQDAWAFKTPFVLPPSTLAQMDFPLGTLRCDNRFAFLLRDAGRRVRNPSRAIITLHHHRGKNRGWVDGGAVPGKGTFVLLDAEL